MASSKNKSQPEMDECVGTLLVHSCDLQELSNGRHATTSGANIQRRVTENIQNNFGVQDWGMGMAPPPLTGGLHSDEDHVDPTVSEHIQDWVCDGVLLPHKAEGRQSDDQASPSLRRRITEKLQNLPAPTHEEVENLTCDM